LTSEETEKQEKTSKVEEVVHGSNRFRENYLPVKVNEPKMNKKR
jgi:hypothetical protein